MGRARGSGQRGVISKLTVFLVSAIFMLATSCSLIYFNAPVYVYSNIVGIFIFSLYFGTAQSIVFVCIIQIIMIKTGLSTEFLNYTFILWIVDVLIIKISQGGIPKSISKNRNTNLIAVIFVSIVMMSILSKPISIAAFSWINGGAKMTVDFFSKAFILQQLELFVISGVITFIFYKIFNRFER